MPRQTALTVLLFAAVVFISISVAAFFVGQQFSEDNRFETRVREVSQNYCDEIESLKAFLLEDAEESYSRRFRTIRILRLEPTPTILAEFDRNITEAREDFSPTPCPRPRRQ